MPINVIDIIKPQNNADFPIVEDSDQLGGYRSVADHTARDAISTAHRKQGMLVHTQNDNFTWQLGGDLTTWTQYATGGGGGVAGSNKDIQINDAGNAGVDTGNFTYDKTLHALTSGQGGIASGTHSTALGRSASATRPGQLAHSSQANNGAEGFNAVDLYAQASAAPADLTQGDAAGLFLDDSKTYSVRVRIVGSKTGSQACAHEVHELLVHTSAGVLVIDDDTTVVSHNLPAWGFTISAPGGLELRVACNPNADTVKFMARVEWAALPGI